MSTEKAKAHYLNRGGSGKMNCGQAIIAAFKDKFSIGEDAVKLFASYGRGNAPDGLCGAYYAAKYMLSGRHPEKINKCHELIMASAGSDKCKEIRKLRKLSCVGCVETMANFVDKVGGGECAPSAGKEPCATGCGKHVISLEGQVRLIAGCMVLAGIVLAWLVHWAFISISLFVGCGLIYAGITDNCLMTIVLNKLPYNRTAQT